MKTRQTNGDKMDTLSAEAWYQKGLEHHTQGELPQALACYRQANRLTPLPEAYNNEGLIHQSHNDWQQAIQCYRHAIRIAPHYSTAYLNLGVLYKQEGDFENAIGCLQQSIQFDPHSAKAHTNLGNILREQNQLEQSLDHQRIAYQLAPDIAEIQTNLGATLLALKRYDEAKPHLESAITLKPNYPESYANLGILYQSQRQYSVAIKLCQQAITLDPNNAKYHFNLGMTYYNHRQFDQAYQHYQKAMSKDPDNPEIHLAKAFVHLINADFEPGWQEYEWRLKAMDKPLQRTFTQTPWSGQSLQGKRLLIHTEQGLGDVLQFIRFIHLLKIPLTSIIVDCQQALSTLLARTLIGAKIITHQQPLPAFDYWIPLLSLPGRLGITLDTIPNQVPYIKSEIKSYEYWQSYFKPYTGLKIGLCWAGNPQQKNDFNRSATLKDFEPILKLKTIHCFSLQIGPKSSETKDSPTPVIDLSPSILSWEDTLAIIDNLDAVVTVCTAIAHAAGALNKPTFIALCTSADWRWFIDRTDSPWYPSARLYHQQQPGEWHNVFVNIAKDLRHFEVV